MRSLGEELGGPERARAMIDGKGVSLILKSIEVRFRRPVRYPDTVSRVLCSTTDFIDVAFPPPQLLIGYKPLPPPEDHSDDATFFVTGSAYSLTQKAFVAHSKESLVWYDYDILKKCDPGEKAKEILFSRVRK